MLRQRSADLTCCSITVNPCTLRSENSDLRVGMGYLQNQLMGGWTSWAGKQGLDAKPQICIYTFSMRDSWETFQYQQLRLQWNLDRYDQQRFRRNSCDLSWAGISENWYFRGICQIRFSLATSAWRISMRNQNLIGRISIGACPGWSGCLSEALILHGRDGRDGQDGRDGRDARDGLCHTHGGLLAKHGQSKWPVFSAILHG